MYSLSVWLLLVQIIPYKWNQIIWDLLSLASSIWYNVFKVHPRYNRCWHCIPFYGSFWITLHCTNIPFIVYAVIEWWMDIWIISIFWPLLIILWWTSMYNILCRYVFIFLDIYLWIELLGHRIIPCLTFGDLSNYFPNHLQNLALLLWDFQCLQILVNTYCS